MEISNSIRKALEAIAAGVSTDELEGQLLGFKSDSTDPRKMGNVLAKAAICFANAH